MIQSIKNSTTKNFKSFLSPLPIHKASYSKKTAIVLFLLLGFSYSILAQKENKAATFDELIYVEADPFAYINKGYSIHLGYENWGMRFDLTKVKVDFPENFEEAFYGTKAFDLVTHISGIKIDYVGNRTNWTKGAFAGIDLNHQRLHFTHRTSLQAQNLSTLNIGLRAGYKFNLWKGFYISPWAAVWKNIHTPQSFTIENDMVATNKWDWITTLHFGYAIKLQ